MKLGHHISSDSGEFRPRAEQVIAMEKAGLDVVWVSEAYGLDAVSRLAYLAAKTERVLIGTSILPIYSRTPALLAQTAAGQQRRGAAVDGQDGGADEHALGFGGQIGQPGHRVEPVRLRHPDDV